MNIKFVFWGLVIIGGLLFGNELYWKKQFEDQARDYFKSMKLPDSEALRALPVKGEILNQYPNIHLYMNYTQTLPSSVNIESAKHSVFEPVSNQMFCGFFEFMQREEADRKDKYRAEGVVTVVEEDNVTMTMNIKDKLGQTLFEKTQKLSECPEFIALKNTV